ncbi:ROK family transcriptional regulator [Streptomyces sp. NPDC029674]|uniref:ROK family transcriptional regulator n=1 Tax=Streptomyces sp. NPDC029674 TaxID=3365297 RepID=UPI0038512A24
MPVSPASPSTARAINDRLALGLLQSEGPLTATQLKQLTGLSRPSVADLVERLQGSGLITVVGEAGAQRRGPNARLYGIVADRAHLAALDVRTDSVSVVVTDLVGAVLAEASATVGGDTEAALAGALDLVGRTAGEGGVQRLHTIGIGAPGLIDPATGDLHDTTSLPAWHRRLAGALQERLGARVLVENETNLAARAERRDGAAHDRDTFVLLWLGDGVGAAVVLDGVLRRGASGGTGEIGFLPVPGTGSLPSATGCEGGFHSLACASALRELGAEHGLLRSGMSAADVVRHAVEAHEDAFLDAVADRIAIGTAAMAAILDPGCVVLGGEVGRAGGTALATRVAARVTAMSPLRTEVRAGTLGGAAVLRGALLAARDAAQDELFGRAAEGSVRRRLTT